MAPHLRKSKCYYQEEKGEKNPARGGFAGLDAVGYDGVLPRSATLSKQARSYLINAGRVLQIQQ